MAKVIRLTESDLQRIVKKVITEQTEERNFIRAIQQFLNIRMKAGLTLDGRTGPNSQTEQAIEKYQSKIGVPNVDGVWGVETWNKMPINDKRLLKKLVAQEGDLIDKFLHWIGLD